MPIATIRVTYPDQSGFIRLVSAASNSGSQLFYNSSTTVTIFFTNAQRGNVQTVDAAPLEPGGAISFDGSQDVYAFTVTPGTFADISVLPSATNRALGNLTIQGNVNATVTGNVNVTNTPSVTVTGTPNVNIASGSVAITTPAPIDVSAANVNILPQSIGPFTQLYGQGTQNGASAFTVAGGAGNSNTVLNLIDVSKYASYDLSFAGFVATQNTAGAALVAGITLQWFDDNTSGVAVYQEQWQVWVAGSLVQIGAPFPNVWGTGKMHGRYLTVKVVNIGGTQLTCQYMHIFGSPRDCSVSNWRQDATAMSIASATGFTLLNVGGSPALNTLGLLAGSPLSPSTTYFVPLNLFSGPIYVRSNANNAWNNPLVLATALGMQFGNPAVGTACPGILWNFGTATGDQISGASLTAIRAPLFLVGVTTSTASPNWSLDTTMKEGQ